MIVLSASDLGKNYGTEVILEGVSFHINAGDRVGIVGRNGAGKTTLLNMLTGELAADDGNFFISKDVSVGYLKQRDVFDSERTVIEEVSDIFSGLDEMEREIERLAREIAEEATKASADEKSSVDGASSADETSSVDVSSSKWTRLNTLQHEFERKGGYTYKSEINGVLSSMAFGEEYYDQKTNSLSGGERTRLSLACLLLKKPDILFLDEPTNHLDIGTLKWLEQYLKSYSGTIVLISHDRYFLDQTVNRVFEVEDKHLTVYEGNYTEYQKKRKQSKDIQQKAFNKQQEEIKRQEALIRSYKERGTEKLAKRAASREKRLAHIERLEKPKGEQATLKIDFKENFQSGYDALLAENLAGGFDGKNALFKNVDFDIKRGERICIVGANGIGKTTLLRTLIGEIPEISGYIRHGHNLEFGYYDQGQQLLTNSNTVIDEIHNEHRLYTDGEIRNILGRFLFRGDMVFRNVGDLSGGEKARLSLLKLMMSGANFLVLDEPTNHLDIESKEAFEDALSDYPGTVITVTHDRYFLNKIPDRIFELTADGIREYLGKYDYYLAKKESAETGKAYLKRMSGKEPKVVAADNANEGAANGNPEKVRADKTDSEKSEQQVIAAESLVAGSKEERQLQKQREAEERRRARENERLMTLISTSEERICELEVEMMDPAIASDYEALAKLAKEMAELKEIVENAYDEWDNLS
ncbi:MAG: ABC-F family ATP-binding cassette domain-containing protein [Firmicutes bacterium]|nr:ABC-F family ATP-binding cassette domain-containing protein [Bacillota bacterium]